MCDGFEVLGGPAREVSALGKVLAQQAVGVLVCWPLPGRVGVGEEHLRARLQRELGVAGELLAAVPGERLAELFGQLRHRRGERGVHRDGAVAAERRSVLHVRLSP